MKPSKRPRQSGAKPLHVVSPATASEIRRTVGVTKTNKRNVERAFHAAGVKAKPQPRPHARKRPKSATGIKVRPARCKRVLVILNNRIEIVELLREEIHPPLQHADFDEEPREMAFVLFAGVEVFVPCHCVIFLHDRNESNRKRKPAAALKSRWSPGGFVIEGTLPNGKYIAIEVSGGRVVVNAYGRPAA